MELIFNEQSIIPSAPDRATACKAVMQFTQTYKEAKKLGFKNKVRFEEAFDQLVLLDSFTLKDFCQQPSFRTVASLILGIAKHPFIDDNSPEEERFVSNNFFITRDSHKTPVQGLGVAYIYHTAAISFGWDKFWNEVTYPLWVEGSEEGMYNIVSLSQPAHCLHSSFTDWIASIMPVELINTTIEPTNKPIALRDDHGQDKLMKLAKSIRNSSYVTAVINSLPFNPHDAHFIKNVYPDGKVEIVLHRTDKGYGMIIQTTGRNLKETEEIAKRLTEEYGT